MIEISNDRERIILSGLLYNIGKFFNKSKKYSNLNFLNYLSEKKLIKKDLVMEYIFVNKESGSAESDKLLKILQQAVEFSIGKAEGNKSEENMLISIFSHISLGDNKEDKVYKYNFKKFNEKDIFPEKALKYSSNEVDKYIEEFLREVEQIKTESFKTFYAKLLDVIKKYCWCVPAVDEINCDISLYDNLKITSAIALVLFDSDENENQFILLGGDISGIQKYIYGLENSSGAAKRLRARSFFIKLLSDIAAYKIIEELKLTLANIVISSGGKFYILAPNKKEVKEKLDKIRDEVNSYLFKNYYGELFLNIQRIEITGEDLKDNFCEKYDALNDKLDEGKYKKFVRETVEMQVLEEEFYGANKKVSQCKICGKTLTDSIEKICDKCIQDADLGSRLPKMKKLAFYNEAVNPQIKFDVSLFRIGCKILDENQEIKGTPFIVHYYDEIKNIGDHPCNRDFYGGYTPLNENNEVMDFGDIAEKSKSENLGIIKGDVDNLGLIFSLGLKNRGKISMSRIASLSRMMDSFFSYWLVNELKRKKYHYVVYAGGDDFMIVAPWDKATSTAKDINDKFAEFTGHNKDITLTCGISITKPKDPIYFSSQWATDAEELGKDSGKNGFVLFNRYVPWNKYDEVFELADFIDAHMTKKGDADERAVYNQSFLYRLLNYTEMAEQYMRDRVKDSRKLRYISQFDYDISRNLYPKIKDKNGDNKINPLEDERIMKLRKYFGMEGIFKEKSEDIFISNYMRVVLNYVIRKNRGEEDGRV